MKSELPQLCLADSGHNGRISPGRIPPGSRHAVHHLLFLSGSRRNDYPAGTHAKGIHAPPFDVGDKTIFCCRQIFSSSCRRMILYAIDQVLGMLHSQPHRKIFRNHKHRTLVKHPVNIPGGMSRCQNHIVGQKFPASCHNTPYSPFLQQQIGHPAIEINLPAILFDRMPDIHNHSRQLIRA